MKEDAKPTETTSRRQFTKAAVIAAIAAPIATFLASCTKQPRQVGEPTPAPSPAPTEEKRDGDGSPITVGGGGGNLKKDKTEEPNVSCTFKEDDDHYPEEGNAGNKKKFKNKKGWKIKTFMIRSDGNWEDYSGFLPANGACTITIECDGGDASTVTIDGDAFGIGMDTDTYKKQSDGYYRNPNAAQYIKHVFLTVPGDFPVNKTFNEGNQAKVCVDFVKPDKSMCGRPTPTP